MKLCRRIISSLSVLALMGTLVTYMPDNFFLRGTPIVSAEGGTGVDSGGGTGGGGDTPVAGDLMLTDEGATGVRVYFCSNKVYINSKKAITDESCAYLDEYKKYAMYEFSSGAWCKSIYNQNCTAYSWGSNGKCNAIPSKQILGSANDANTFNFSTLLGSNTRNANLWLNGDNPRDVSDISKWANEKLGDSLTPSVLNAFITNYRKQLGASVYDNLNLPADATEFVSADWSIIVEPVLVLRYAGGDYVTAPKYVVSYNDFYRPQDTKATGSWVSNVGVNSFFYKMQNYGVGGTNDTIYLNCASKGKGLGGLYCDFDSELFRGYTKVHISTENSATLRGFGVFAQGTKIFVQGEKLAITKNITIVGNSLNPISRVGVNTNASRVQVAIGKSNANSTQLSKAPKSLNTSTISETDWLGTKSKSIELYTYNNVAESNFNTTTAYGIADMSVRKSESFCRLVGKNTTDLNDMVLLSAYSATVIPSNGSTISKLFNATDDKNTLNKLKLESSLSFITNGEAIGNDTAYVYGNRVNGSLYNTASGTDSAYSLSAVRDSFQTNMGTGQASELFSNRTLASNNATQNVNFVGNINTYAYSQSKVNTTKSSSATMGTITSAGVGLRNTVGLSFEVLVPDVKITHNMQTITRDVDGNISYGDNKKSGEKSIFTDVYSARVAKAKSGVASYLVVVPNSYGNRNYIDASGTNAKKAENFAELIFKDENSYFTADGLTRLTGKANDKLKDASVAPVTSTANGIVLGAYADSKGAYTGYTVYRVEDSYATKPQDTSMTLEPEKLNYVFPTLLGDSEGYFVRTVSPTILRDFDISKVSDKYKGTVISAEGADSTYNLLYSKIALPDSNNGTIAQLFDVESKTVKPFEKVATPVTLNHAVCLTRGAFNDKYVVSSLYGANRSFADNDYVTGVLGMTYGNIGSKSPSSISAGTTKLFETGNDSFIWACDKSMTYSYQIRRSDGKTVPISYSTSPFSDGSSQQSAGYNVKENIFRYVAQDKGIGYNTSKQLTAVRQKAQKGELGYKIFGVSASDKLLKFYPEVAMLAWKYDVTNPILTSNTQVKQGTLYVLGEKVRALNPSSMYGITVKPVDGKNISGATKSDTVATGSKAKALSKRMHDLQVIYAGGNVNLSAQTKFELNLSGFALDQIDPTLDTEIIGANGKTTYSGIIADSTDVKDAWGSAEYRALTQYETWVKEVRDSLSASVSLQVKDGNRLVKEYSGFKSSIGRLSGGDVESITSYALTFKDGAVVKDDAYEALMQAIIDNCDVEGMGEAMTLFNNSGIFKSITNSIESSTNGKSGSASCFDGANWYDEQVRTFVIRYYKCKPITLKNISVSDKLDITSGPSQNTKNKELFSKGYLAQWTLSLYLNKPNVAMPDLTIYSPKNNNVDADSLLVYAQHIEDADFIISDATTSDARK